MATITCATCDGKGRLCVECGKPEHRDQSNSARRWGQSRCWRILGARAATRRVRDRTKPCPNHTPQMIECDLCSVRVVHSGRPDGWKHEKLPAIDKYADVCPNCVGSLRVGFDYTVEKLVGGNDGYSVQASIACAWAFHLGQYEASAIVEGWERNDSFNAVLDKPRFRAWRNDPTFVEPRTLGAHGWGRWSQVRRETSERDRTEPPLSRIHVLHEGVTLCGEQLPMPVSSGAIDALGDRGTWVRLEDWGNANCVECQRRAEARYGTDGERATG